AAAGRQPRAAAAPHARRQPGPPDDPTHELLPGQTAAPGGNLRALPGGTAGPGRDAPGVGVRPELADPTGRRAARLPVRGAWRRHAPGVRPRRPARRRLPAPLRL